MAKLDDSTGGGGGTGGSGDGGGGGGFFDFISSWGDLAIPGWLSRLSSVSDTLIKFGKDPRGFILSVLALWLVEQLLSLATGVLNSLLSAWELVASIPGMVASALLSAGSLAGQPVLTIIGTLGDLALGVVWGLGWTAPLVGALLVVVYLEVGEEVAAAAAPAVSDLLGAIPVVGSLLDAVLTFLINLVGGES